MNPKHGGRGSVFMAAVAKKYRKKCNPIADSALSAKTYSYLGASAKVDEFGPPVLVVP